MTRSLDVSDVKFGRKILDLVEKTAYDIVKYHLLEVLTFVHLNKKIMNSLVKPIPRFFGTFGLKMALNGLKMGLKCLDLIWLDQFVILGHG